MEAILPSHLSIYISASAWALFLLEPNRLRYPMGLHIQIARAATESGGKSQEDEKA